MSVDRATVRRIARLARLAITEEEAGRLEQELSGILDWVAQLDEIDTSAVEPMTRVAAMTMKKRKDEVTDGFCAADILKNAPEVDDDYFVVPEDRRIGERHAPRRSACVWDLGSPLRRLGARAKALPEGTFASTKEDCAKLKEKTVAELGQDIDFTVFSKTGVDANAQRCDLVSVTPRNATSWLATAFCEESGYAFPDVFAIMQKKTGDLNVTRMTVQQESYDEPEDESVGVRRRSRSVGDGPAREAAGEPTVTSADTTAGREQDLNAFFRCDSVKP